MKKLINVMLTLAMFLSLVPANYLVTAEDKYDNQHQALFTYILTEPSAEGENGKAVITGFVDNYKELLGSSTEIVIPDIYVNTDTGVKYNCELSATKSKFMKDNNYITNVTMPSYYKSVCSMFFQNATALKNVTFKSESSFNFFVKSLSGCTSLEKMYVYADKLSNSPAATIFTGVPTSAIAYVKNETVKEQLVNWPGIIIVDPDMNDSGSDIIKDALKKKIDEVESFLSGIDKTKYTNIEALETELSNAKTVYNNGSATQDDVNNATNLLAAAFDKVEEIVDKTVLIKKIEEISVYLNELGLDQGLYTGINAVNTAHYNAIKVNIKATATQAEVDEALSKLNTAYDNIALKTTNVIELKNALIEESNFIQGKKDIDYNLNDLRAAADSASTVYYDESASQIEIDQVCADLKAAQEAVTKKNAEAQITEMNGIIDQLEALNEKDYTKDSWSAVETAITYAKSINDGLVSQYITAIEDLKAAMSTLELKPQNVEEAGEPIAIIQKNAVETTLGEFTADEAVAGATKIKITFDCAPDVSFNQYASIEMKANIAGTESYMKFVGTDTTETAGAKGFTIELPLSNAINSGDDVKLVAYTWAWANASDYVYAVTKVEYINAVGQVVKAVTDRTIALDDLKAAIAEAEKIESANYTEESYAALTAALTAARELPEDSAKADIEAAKTALETAVSGLAEKTDDSSSEPTPDSESEPDSKQDSSSTPDSATSSETDSKTDNSSSKTDESNSSTTSKTDSASSGKANTTSNANSGANGSSNPNTGAASATAAGIILLSAIGVIASRKK